MCVCVCVCVFLAIRNITASVNELGGEGGSNSATQMIMTHPLALSQAAETPKHHNIFNIYILLRKQIISLQQRAALMRSGERGWAGRQESFPFPRVSVFLTCSAPSINISDGS